MMNSYGENYKWMTLALSLTLGACTAGETEPVGMTGVGGDTDGGHDGDDETDDDAPLDVGTSELPPAEECATVVAEAQPVPGMANIIFAVDNSGSMGFEADEVQARMNSFSAQIADGGVDARVVLVSSYPDDGNGICMAPPLGELSDQGEGCSEANYDDHPDSLAFTHVDEKVKSHDAWERLLDTHDQWAGVVRSDAKTHVVVVTDDTSALDWQQFEEEFLALDPSHADFVHHSVVCHSDCESAAGIGENYITLTSETGGVAADLCDQDFQPVFDELAAELIGTSVLACEFELPAPPDGRALELDQAELELDDGMGQVTSIERVNSPTECDQVADGWHYDDPEVPTAILMCPQTCDRAQGLAGASVHIGLVCESGVVG